MVPEGWGTGALLLAASSMWQALPSGVAAQLGTW